MQLLDNTLQGHGLATAGPCLIFLLILICAPGCDQESPTLPPEERKARAVKAVERFYDAAARGDCDTVMELVPKFKSRQECEHFSERFAGNGLRFIGASKVEIDGRDPNAVIIEAETMRRGESDKMLLRAKQRNGEWIIVF